MQRKPRFTRLVICILCSSCSLATAQRPHVIPEDPLSPEEQLTRFHLPPGFEIELVASEPRIHNPLSINFDRQGRMWVSDTFEYPFPPKGPGRDALKVFEDRDGDGQFETVLTFADQLSMPTGSEPIPGGALVFSIPSIHGCFDTDGDGIADERKVLYTEFGNVDAHGMNNGFTRWLDGWIYACHGYANTSTVKGSDGHTISMNSGNGYRFRMDGSHIEYVWHGQVNPYGIAFDAFGNLFTADCHSKPAYCLLRGAYYPSFGKPHDGLGFGPQLIEHTHGSTSISGIAYYEDDHFPEEYQQSVYMGNSVTGRVNRDRISYQGSSLVGNECPDFVTCDDRWFRPVEVKLGTDGALYIADFYDCIIGYYEVPLTHPRRDRERGRIWRVTYRGTDEKPRPLPRTPDLSELNLEQLWERLADPNITVRRIATHEIVDRFGNQAVPSLKTWLTGSSIPLQRVGALWILERLESLDDVLVARLTEDDDRLVRAHLVRALAERSDWNATDLDATELVCGRLFDPDSFVRRAAADALGRHPHADNVELLLKLWKETPPEDTFLIHVLRMALRDQLKEPQIFAKAKRFQDEPENMQRLVDVSLGLRDASSAAFVLSAIQSGEYPKNRVENVIRHMTRYLPDDQLDQAVEFVLRWQESSYEEQLQVFASFSKALEERGAPVPEQVRQWAERLSRELLATEDGERLKKGIQLAGQMRVHALFDTLATIAKSRERSAELRTAAMIACVNMNDPRRLEMFDSVLGNVQENMGMRRAGAIGLMLINSNESRQRLFDRLLTAHHLLAVDLAAALGGTRPGAEMLLKAIEEGKASPSLLREIAVIRRLEGANIEGIEDRIETLTAELPTQDELTAQLIAERRQSFMAAKPDSKQGHELWVKHCSVCHQLRSEGKKYGPDLDGIGIRGLERLLEDTMDPSRNVDPTFRSTAILTTEGLVHTGLALRDEGNILLLIDAEGKEIRIPHGEIEERKVSPLSPMPTPKENAITVEQFNHLMQFLLEAKETPEVAGE